MDYQTSKTRIFSFDPVEPSSARLLIVGSMPGQASLSADQYYAHPRNAFWPIMAQLLGFDPKADYEVRVQALKESGIGLWDVCKACVRNSSLDSDIVEETIIINNFPGWFERHPETQAVFCNGTKAYDSYRKRVIPELEAPFKDLPVQRLPSTSPAHAGRTVEDKAQAWSVVQKYLEG